MGEPAPLASSSTVAPSRNVVIKTSPAAVGRPPASSWHASSIRWATAARSCRAGWPRGSSQFVRKRGRRKADQGDQAATVEGTEELAGIAAGGLDKMVRTPECPWPSNSRSMPPRRSLMGSPVTASRPPGSNVFSRLLRGVDAVRVVVDAAEHFALALRRGENAEREQVGPSPGTWVWLFSTNRAATGSPRQSAPAATRSASMARPPSPIRSDRASLHG